MKQRFAWACVKCEHREDRWMTADEPKKPCKCPACGKRGALKRDYTAGSIQVVGDDYGKAMHIRTLNPTLPEHQQFGCPVIRSRTEMKQELDRQRRAGNELSPNFPV